MRPWFETVTIPVGQTCLIYDRCLPEFGFNWHYHPEYELTLTVGSFGNRFVGGSVAPYVDGDLVLVGPNLPHAWQSERLATGAENHRAIVCWFTGEWISGLIELMPELRPIRSLLDRSTAGVVFDPQVSQVLRQSIIDLTEMPQTQRVIGLQSILLTLACSPTKYSLALGNTVVRPATYETKRMEAILDWLHRHYTNPIRLEPICKLAHISESQLQRIFKRSTGQSISRYIARLRIGKACSLLAESDKQISAIAIETGFSDTAHFSRSFSQTVGQTPSSYRRSFR